MAKKLNKCFTEVKQDNDRLFERFSFNRDSKLKLDTETNLKLQNYFLHGLQNFLNLEELCIGLDLDLKDGLQLLKSFGMSVDTGSNTLSKEFNSKLIQLTFREKMADYLIYNKVKKEDMQFITKVLELSSKSM